MSIRLATTQALRRCGLMPKLNAIWRWRLRLTKQLCRLRNTSSLDAIYSARYFAAEEEMTEPTAKEAVDCILEQFSPRTLVDVGCGTAVYLKYFHQRGVRIKGIDGSAHAIEKALVDASYLEQRDLSQLATFDETFDLVLCLEVGEHLPTQYAPVLAENLTRLGDTILFSAALPGQGGVDHVNEQPSEFWIAIFEGLGYGWDEAATRQIRDAFRARGCVWWLLTNTLVFHADRPSE